MVYHPQLRRTSNYFQMLQQRQHILTSYFKTPSVVVVQGFNSQLPAQQEHLCDVERNDTSTSKPVARQSNLLNHFPYIQTVRRFAKLQNKDLPFRSALFILTVSTNAFHSANLFLFSHHHIPTNSKAPFFHLNTHTTYNSFNHCDEGLTLETQLIIQNYTAILSP